MQIRLRHRRPVQLEVFQPRPSTPLFATLPAEVKRRAQRLLAQLLKEHYVGGSVSADGEEMSDE